LIKSEQDKHTAWRAFKLLVPYKNDKKMWEHTKAKSFAALLAEALQDDYLLGENMCVQLPLFWCGKVVHQQEAEHCLCA
jgi:hypothetical protein